MKTGESVRIAVYYDFFSAPRVVDIPAQETLDYIEAIASTSYELSLQQGGILPYSVIHEISENFIHAGFTECTVSIFDGGNTICFADQGPGILKKDAVLRPGVSSATQEMKAFIRGVGSGFPLVREFLASVLGSLSIEDNATNGVVITLSVPEPTQTQSIAEFMPSAASEPLSAPVATAPPLIRNLNEREERALMLLHEYGILGPKDLAPYLSLSAPTAFRLLEKLGEVGMVESTQLKKRILSNAGMAYVQEFLVLDT